MPSGVLPIVLARHYGGDPATALQVVLSTTLLGNDALREEVTDRFAAKGEEVVQRNHDLIDRAAAAVPAGA